MTQTNQITGQFVSTHRPWMPFIALGGLYVLAQIITIFNLGLFHDDPSLYLLPKTGFDLWQDQARSAWTVYGEILRFVYSGPGGLVMGRFIVFTSHLLAGGFFYLLLIRLPGIGSPATIRITGLFLLLPISLYRISGLSVITALSYLEFFLAWWLFMVYLGNRKLVLRLICLALFALSFFRESILVFYALPMALMVVHELNRKPKLADLIKLAFRYADFLLLPMVFWLLRDTFFKPIEYYSGHTQISLLNVAASPLTVLYNVNDTLWASLKLSLQAFVDYPLRVVALTAAAWVFFRRLGSEVAMKSDWAWMGFGLAAIFLALFPYVAIGRDVFTGFGTRHLMLLPMGVAFLVYFGLKRIFAWGGDTGKLLNLFICFLLACGAYATLEKNLDFQQRYLIREAMVQAIRDNPKLAAGRTFALVDRGYYYRTQPYRPMDVLGILREAFGDGARFGMFVSSDDDPSAIKEQIAGFNREVHSAPLQTIKEMLGYPDWHFSPGDPICEVTLFPGPGYPNQRTAVVLTALRLLAPERFREQLASMIRLKVKSLE